MGFFDFLRSRETEKESSRVQETLENKFERLSRDLEFGCNLPQIINEIEEVNSSWEAELERRRREK